MGMGWFHRSPFMPFVGLNTSKYSNTTLVSIIIIIILYFVFSVLEASRPTSDGIGGLNLDLAT